MKIKTLSFLAVILTMSFMVARHGAPREAGNAAALPHTLAKADAGADFVVGSDAKVAGVKRLGINLGLWSYWGAEQLMNNVLKNPGFEGLIDRAVVIVSQASATGFNDDTSWLGRADGFWQGADFEVRTGASAGQKGKIASSRKSGASGLPDFTTVGNAPPLAKGDVISLTRQTDTALPTQWWFPPDSTGYAFVERNDRRPGSPGQRSLSFKPVGDKTVEVASYLDTITDRAGKLLPVRGTWRLSFWVRAAAGKPSLNIDFHRSGTPAFIYRTITPSSSWTKVSYDFTGSDTGPSGSLELHFRVTGNGANLLLDDVELGAVQTETFPFRTEVVNALKQLHPGYLRDWEGQMGDTVANRLATSFARRASRYRPDNDGTDFFYSLPEFLDLCAKVDAAPWIMIPPTFTDDDLAGLGKYLATQTRFSEILLEFGNENWNQVFRPAGIPDPVAHGAAATRAFQKIRAAAGSSVALTMIVNGQHSNPEYSGRFAQYAPTANMLALAPYFLYSMSAGTPQTQTLSSMFLSGTSGQIADEARQLQSSGKELAIYEVNLHTTEGNASSAERDPITVGAASGAAVSQIMLDAISVGIRKQCIYTFTGYDAWLANYSGFVKLWGILRDVGETERMRPTGLALTMLNQAIAGDMMQVNNRSGAQASVYAFKNKAAWTLAAVSTSASEQTITVSFPAGATPPTTLSTLSGATPTTTNETAANVQIVKDTLTASGSTITFRLPPYRLAVVLAKEKK